MRTKNINSIGHFSKIPHLLQILALTSDKITLLFGKNTYNTTFQQKYVLTFRPIVKAH